MSTELELKLQAFLDGELSEREAREVAAAIEADPEARKLFAELKTTASALRDNEPQLTVPESREFYWSKIEKAIECSEPEPVAPMLSFWIGLRRIMVPAAGVALVLFLGIASLRMNSTDSLGHLAEVENLSEHMSSFSFRSQSHNMFVVWLHENADHQAAGESEAADLEDEIIQ
jgi:anti-sigma factor RsiW